MRARIPLSVSATTHDRLVALAKHRAETVRETALLALVRGLDLLTRHAAAIDAAAPQPENP